MSDFKRMAEDATTKAALTAGKDAAKRALDNLLSDSETAPQDGAKPKEPNSKRTKLLLFVFIAICLVIGVIGLVASYWHWFLGLGLLGLVGYVGWRRLSARRLAKRESSQNRSDLVPTLAEPAKIVVPLEDAAPPTPHTKKALPETRLTPTAEERAHAYREAKAVEEQAVDEELAALKARMKR